MPLTPEDVRNKRFTPVRLREGYDMGEVDQFLDEIEAELERLYQENQELRAKAAAAAQSEPTAAFDAVRDVKPIVEPEPEPIAPQPAPAVIEPPRGPSVGEASAAAARLLEIASNNADELIENAKAEADAIIGEAKEKADRLTREARGNADRTETEARIRAQKLDEETAARRQSAFDAIERERQELQRDVEHLRAYEREYRARLKNYFQTQLDMLESQESVSGSLPAEAPAQQAPRRLRTLLGDEEDGAAE